MSTDGESVTSAEEEKTTFVRTAHRKYFTLASKSDFLYSCSSESLLQGPTIVWSIESCIISSLQALRGLETRLYNVSTSLSHDILLEGHSIIAFRKHRIAVYKLYLSRVVINAACEWFTVSNDATLHALSTALVTLLHINDTSISHVETSKCASFTEFWNKTILQCELLTCLFTTLAPERLLAAYQQIHDLPTSEHHRIVHEYATSSAWSQQPSLRQWEVLRSLLGQLESAKLSSPPPSAFAPNVQRRMTSPINVAVLSYLLQTAAAPVLRQVESVLYCFNAGADIKASQELQPAESLFSTDGPQDIFVTIRKVIEWSANRTAILTQWISGNNHLHRGVSLPLHVSSATANNKEKVLSRNLRNELIDNNLEYIRSWMNIDTFVPPSSDAVSDPAATNITNMDDNDRNNDEEEDVSELASEISADDIVAIPKVTIEPEAEALHINNEDYVMTDGVIPRAIPRSEIDAAKQYLLNKYASLSKPLDDREALAKWRHEHLTSLKEKQKELKRKLYDELEMFKEESTSIAVDAVDDISSITSSTYTRDGHLPHHNRILQAPGGTSTFSLAHDTKAPARVDEKDSMEVEEIVDTEMEILDTEEKIAVVKNDESVADVDVDGISVNDITLNSEQGDIMDDEADSAAADTCNDIPMEPIIEEQALNSGSTEECPRDEIKTGANESILVADDELFLRLRDTVGKALGAAISSEAEAFVLMQSFPHAFSILCKNCKVYSPFDQSSEYTHDDLTMMLSPLSVIMEHNLATALKEQCLMVDQKLLSYALRSMHLLQHIDFVQKLFLLSDKSDFVMVFVSDLVDSYFESAASRVLSGSYAKRKSVGELSCSTNIWSRRNVESCFTKSITRCNLGSDGFMNFVQLAVLESPPVLITGKESVLDGAYELTNVSNISMNYVPPWPLDQLFCNEFIVLANRVQHRLLHLNQLMALSRHVWREMKFARPKAPTDMQDLRDRNMYFGYRQVRQCLQVLVDYTANRIRHSYYELQHNLTNFVHGGYGAVVVLMRQYIKEMAHAVLVCEYVPMSKRNDDEPPLFEKFPMKSMRSTWKGLATNIDSLIGACHQNLLVLHRMCLEGYDEDMSELTKHIARLKSKIVVTGVIAKDIEVSCKSHADVLLMLLQSVAVLA